ncbi:hypothetical protein [Nocardioides sp. Arc9.136]|uniref:hypothetical protein n=1 Tax=Nocardioides sp. Arc9.136 TaxID=2996826 RepID=UPI0026662D87|nr:hypothetical protein [Nocardioides sp. Arc9.136]WKN47132.1 hypothetical protein OSR43_13900 [Nocardioides sp. Arc9.136]
MKALTVQQPWAWAIVHGGKDVENRTQAWSYRGPLAIHAGQRVSERGLVSPLVRDAWDETANYDVDECDDWELGAIIGVVDLVGVHVAEPEIENDSGSGVWAPACCESPWAEQAYDEHGGRTRRDVVHLGLANPRPLPEPLPCKGRLGLWTPPADVLDQLQAVIA